MFEIVNQCFKICSWIPLTIVKFLLLNSALLKIIIPALDFNFAITVMNPPTVCGLRLHLRNSKQLDIFACCTLICTRNPLNFLGGIHLHFITCLKISFWNPGTYRRKNVHLSSAQFGLVMTFISPMISQKP